MLTYAFPVFVLVLVLTGCAAGPQAATEVKVQASDFSFSPATIIVPAGEPVTVQFENTGLVEHDFVIDQIDVSGVEASDSGPAQHHGGHQPEFDLHVFAGTGDAAVLKFTALKPGTYEIFCSIEGHREAGMIGKLVVEQAGG